MDEEIVFAVFEGHRLRARGPVADVVRVLWPVPSERQAGLRIFNETTGEAVDFDWRGSVERVVAGAQEQVLGRALGRPKLGVSSREITLLPRHWKWLDDQPGSVSATLRKLIDQKMANRETTLLNIEGLYRQMSGLAGDLPLFEDATRFLYAGQWSKAETIIAQWPGDLPRYFLKRLRTMRRAGQRTLT